VGIESNREKYKHGQCNSAVQCFAYSGRLETILSGIPRTNAFEQKADSMYRYLWEKNCANQQAVKITKERPDYDLFENNCQNFARYLVEEICPGSFCPATIQNVLVRWRIFSAYSQTQLPRRYPPQALESLQTNSSDSQMSFVTATSCGYETATESSWISAVQSIASTTVSTESDSLVVALNSLALETLSIDSVAYSTVSDYNWVTSLPSAGYKDAISISLENKSRPKG